jgi:hypothetical protein
MVKEEIRVTDRCTIPQSIASEVKARHCACEIRNRQGSCYPGNVNAVVKKGNERDNAPAVGGANLGWIERWLSILFDQRSSCYFKEAVIG